MNAFLRYLAPANGPVASGEREAARPRSFCNCQAPGGGRRMVRPPPPTGGAAGRWRNPRASSQPARCPRRRGHLPDGLPLPGPSAEHRDPLACLPGRQLRLRGRDRADRRVRARLPRGLDQLRVHPRPAERRAALLGCDRARLAPARLQPPPGSGAGGGRRAPHHAGPVLRVPAAGQGARAADLALPRPDPRPARPQQDRRLPARERRGALRHPGRGPARALQRRAVRRQSDRRRARREPRQGQLPGAAAGPERRDGDQRPEHRDPERRAGRHRGPDPDLWPGRPAGFREPLQPGDGSGPPVPGARRRLRPRDRGLHHLQPRAGEQLRPARHRGLQQPDARHDSARGAGGWIAAALRRRLAQPRGRARHVRPADGAAAELPETGGQRAGAARREHARHARLLRIRRGRRHGLRVHDGSPGAAEPQRRRDLRLHQRRARRPPQSERPDHAARHRAGELRRAAGREPDLHALRGRGRRLRLQRRGPRERRPGHDERRPRGLRPRRRSPRGGGEGQRGLAAAHGSARLEPRQRQDRLALRDPAGALPQLLGHAAGGQLPGRRPGSRATSTRAAPACRR